MHLQSASHLVLLAVTFGISIARGAIVYDETISGDLSNSGLNPTAITVSPGSNQIFGVTGRGTAGVDQDYFSITIPADFGLFAITVLPGTTSGGVSFIGIQAGSQVTLPTNPADATGLLGWWHYSPADIQTDILGKMAIPAFGSSGFNVPLGAGTYTFWIQDFNAGTFPYGFDLDISRIPEPGSALLVAFGLGAALVFRIRRGKLRGV